MRRTCPEPPNAPRVWDAGAGGGGEEEGRRDEDEAVVQRKPEEASNPHSAMLTPAFGPTPSER